MRVWGLKIDLFLYLCSTAYCGISYLCFAENFGSSLVGLWGAVSILISGVILLKCCFKPSEKLYGDNFLKFCLAINCTIQLPPIICWLQYGENGFELWGILLSGFAAILIHFFMVFWGLLNIQLMKKSN